jgi:uncharacterized membrane protein
LAAVETSGSGFAAPCGAVWSLFLFTGACWLPVVWIQVLQWREARDAQSISALSATFHARFRLWFTLGVAAFAAVIAIYG